MLLPAELMIETESPSTAAMIRKNMLSTTAINFCASVLEHFAFHDANKYDYIHSPTESENANKSILQSGKTRKFLQ